jgi:hypothetical protein
MRNLLISALALMTVAAFVGGCADDSSSESGGSEDEVRSGSTAAKEGQTCGDGTFGTPRISCASGLVCKYPESTAPTGPAGSSSALPGKCGKPGAKEGETCGTGFFGTPKIDCDDGLVCKYPDSTAPTGPAGSSSALPGKCAAAGAKEGETCGNGFFGTPKIDCAAGLTCKFPDSTAPRGPAGSSSALPGKCSR